MTLLAHLVRTDIRQFRWAILLWAVLVIAETAVIAIRPAFMGDIRLYGNVGMIGSLLWSALQIGMLLIVPLIVQAHPAVGTDAFWMTRPIPPRALLASKLVLLVATTVVLSCAARFALMLWIHVPLREALFVTLDTAISSTAWLAVLMAGAAVTLNLPRFALLCGGVIVSFILLTAILLMRMRMGDGAGTATLMVGGSGQPVLPPVEDPTEAIIFLLCVAAAGFALAAIQYRTRLRRVSVPAAAGGLVLAILAIPYWPFPLLRVQSALPAWTSAVQLHAASPVIEMNPQMAWPEGSDMVRTGSTRVSVSGLEPGWVPRLELLDASMTLDNGTTLTSRGRGYQAAPLIEGFADNPDRVVGREVLGVERVFTSAPPGSEMTVLLTVPAKAINATLPANGKYRARFAVRLAHWEAVAALPLRAGATFDDDSYRFAIEQVDAGPGEHLAVRAREWRATSSFDRKPMTTYAFYVRSAQHSRALAGNESEPFGGMGAVSFGLPFVMSGGGLERFFLRAAFVSFPPSYGLQEQKIEWDAAWYADADLVLVRMTETGAVLRSLDIPQATVAVRDK